MNQERVVHWIPALGAVCEKNCVRFCVWAPVAENVEVVFEEPVNGTTELRLRRSIGGRFVGRLPGHRVGSTYGYRVDGLGPFPDPASRFQPEGVHGPSEIVDPATFEWSDSAWRGLTLQDLVLYELHVGTFTPSGTFRGVQERLPYLSELGVTGIELMPVAEFPGSRNWGYDGVDLFAPSRNYGRPDDLRRLVNRAHEFGIAVILDVVYNHLGPDGNYLSQFSPFYFSDRHETAWGQALNFDGENSGPVREFFIENALHWIHEYHIDGLRLDATHAIIDEGSPHFVADLVARIRNCRIDRTVLLISEDDRNRSESIEAPEIGGWGLDAVWADDFHHQVRRRLAGDQEGYFCDFTGSLEDLATTIRRGWFFCGEYSRYRREIRGSDPSGIPLRRFIHCLQNHDQVGNRALGERLHHQVDASAHRAASVLLLMSPETPLLFMGQEWGAGSPFLYFSDHEPSLGAKIAQGRRKEFSSFPSFSEPEQAQKIPDPQDPTTFLRSRLQWDETAKEEHAALLRLFRALLRIRLKEPALKSSADEAVSASDDTQLTFRVRLLDEDTIMLFRQDRNRSALAAVVYLPEVSAGDSIWKEHRVALEDWTGLRWKVLLTTEDAAFAPDPNPPEIELSRNVPWIRFARPAAVILKGDSQI